MAGRQLHQWGYQVTILEARNRIGGRVCSDTKSFTNASVDLGASIITGLIGNPLDNPHTQLNLRTRAIGENAALYFRRNGASVPSDVDETMDSLFNELLDAAAKMKSANDKSLGEELDKLIPRTVTADQRGVLGWYYANLEYACAADLKLLSVNHWDQDDPFEFKGEHLMLCDGYLSMLAPLAEGLDIKMGAEVNKVEYAGDSVQVRTSDGKVFEGDYALVTLPLGVLKDEWVKFEPPLPNWKRDAVKRLGFGLLNKVVFEFEDPFWDRTVDWFGSVGTGAFSERGNMYMFWNMLKFTQQPILTALCAGQAGHDHEERTDEDIYAEALDILTKIYKLPERPKPISKVITRWKADKYSRGSYSYIATGSTGDDYDILGRPLYDERGQPRVFFAGEATNRYHPATVAGAFQSGVREAQRIHGLVCPLLPRPDTSALMESQLNAQSEQSRKDRLRRDNQERDSRRPGLHRRRGMRRFRSPTLGTGNQAMKFKYESMFSGNKSSDSVKSEAADGAAAGAAAELQRYVDFTAMFSGKDSNRSSTDSVRRSRDSLGASQGAQRPNGQNSGPKQNGGPGAGLSSSGGNYGGGNGNGPRRDPPAQQRQWQDRDRDQYSGGNERNRSDDRNRDGNRGGDYRSDRDRDRDHDRDRDRRDRSDSRDSRNQISSSLDRDDRSRPRENDRNKSRNDDKGRVYDYRSASDEPPPRTGSAKFDAAGKMFIPESLFSSLAASLSGIPPTASVQPARAVAASASASARPEGASRVATKDKPKREVSDDVRRDFREAVAQLVVQRLNRFFKEGKMDKEDFKHFSRKLTHKILDKEKEKGGSHVMNEKKSAKISSFVDEYYRKKISAHAKSKSARKATAEEVVGESIPSPKRPKFD